MASASDLSQLYLAYFGRPADAGGLAFYAGMPLADVCAAFSASAESLALYGSPFGATQISQIYTTLFNRTGDPSGLAYWTAQVASGGTTPAAVALAMLQGAQSDDGRAVANKLGFVAQWTATFEAQAQNAGVTAAAVLALAKSLIAGVGASQASLDTIIASVPEAISHAVTPAVPAAPDSPPAPAPVSQSFTLTTAIDTISGGAADDTITGTASYTGTTELASSTFNAGTDIIDGGAGSDTLVLSVGGSSSPAVTLSPTAITNVERLQLTTTASATVTLSPTASFTEIVSTNSSSNTTVAGFGANVTRLGVSGLGAGGIITFTPDASAVSGSSDAVTLSLTSNGTSTNSAVIGLTPASGSDYYETLNIVSAGTGNFIKLATSALTSLATINISGSAPLALVPNSSSDKMRVAPLIDASTATGAITLGGSTSSSSLGAADQTVKLGAGDDTVFFGANLTSDDTVDGGAGRDSLSISAALTSGTASALANVSNVEVLRFDISGNSFTQDVSVLAGHGLTAVALSGTGLTAAQFNHLPASGITTVDLLSTMSGDSLALALADGSGSSDALTVRFANAATSATTLGALSNITGLETLNIVSGGSSSTNTITSDSVAGQQVLTGSVPFTVTVPSASGLGMKLDASAFTARLTITGASSGNDTVVLGSGNDVINLRTGTDSITLGTQGINAATGWDLIGVAAGSTDTIRLVSNTAAGNGAATGYTNGAINAALIGSTTSVGTGNATGTVSNLTLVFSASNGDFSLTNAAGAVSTGLAKGSTAQGLVAGDTLVVQSVAQNDAAAAAAVNVTVIKLTTATTFATDIKTTFAAAMGTASVTGLAADANYLVEMYDSTASKTIFAVVNTGASGAGDTTLSAADFTATGMAVMMGVTSASIGSGTSLGVAF